MNDYMQVGIYGEFYIESYDGEVTILSYEGKSSSIVIPSIIGERVVTEIAKKAFENCKLTSVVIPSTIRVIGENAFSGNLLDYVVLPIELEQLGYQAFDNNSLEPNELIHWLSEDTAIVPNFVYEDMNITNPYLDESARFTVEPSTYYGKDNFEYWIKLNQQLIENKTVTYL